MKKSGLYRSGAAFLAALMVFTGMPQGQMYVSAQESGILMEEEENQEQDQLQTASAEEPDVQDEENQSESGTEENEVGTVQPDEDQNEDALDGDVQAEESQDSAEIEESKDSAEAEESQDSAEAGEAPDEAAVAPQADDEAPITYMITRPTKTTYLKGESYDITGAQAINTASTTPVNLNNNNAQVTFDSNITGIRPLTITYLGQSETFNVLVLDKPKLNAEYGQKLSDITDRLPSDDGYGTWVWKNDSQTLNKVGTQTYQANFTSGNSNYQSRVDIDVEVNVTCDLSQYASIELSIPSRGYTYDGTEKKPGVTVSVGGSNLLAGRDYEVLYDNNVNAGTASVIVKGKGNYTESKTETFSIAKAKLTIRATSKTIYCGDPTPDPEKDYEYTDSGLAERDKLTGVKFTCNITDTKAVGTYEIIPSDATVDNSDNYEDEIEYIKGTLTVEVYVPQTVVIAGLTGPLDTTYDKMEWPYGNRARVQIPGATSPVPNVTAVPHYTGTTAAGNSYPDDGGDDSKAPTEAGEYVLTYELVDNEEKPYDRYVFREDSNVFEFTIKQREVIITAPSKTVAAGEEVPEADTLESGIRVTGFLSGDKQDSVLRNAPSLKYSEEYKDISPAKAGTYDIVPFIQVSEGESELKNENYTLVFVNGTLTVEGRKGFEADFTSIKAADKTYDGQPHSISGYATDDGGKSGKTFNYTIQVTNETEKREDEKEPDQDGDGESQDGDDESQNENDLPNYIKQVKGVPITEIVQRYKDIAPVDVGIYKLEIFLELDEKDKNIYEYDGEPLMERVFYVTPLQRKETKLVGVTGITDKEYDGEPVDFSNQISNAKVLTDQNVDITEKAVLKFAIKGTTSTGDDYYKEVNLGNIPASMPENAGKYELHVELVEQTPRNYVKNEWTYPFEIKRRKISITVSDQEMHVGDGRIGEGTLPVERFDDQYQVEGLLAADEDKFKKELSVVLSQAVEADETGVYDLELSGLVEDEWPDYEITWTNAKLTVKGQLHKVKEELKAVTNVPNGTPLEEIAGSYLPKKTTIYLYKSGKAPEPAPPAGEGDEESTDEGSEDAAESVDGDIEMTAEIVWDTTRTAPGTSYNINTKTPQTFKMTGTVQLPELVYADSETPLTVTVSVSVREAYEGQALRPTADVKTGRVSPGTKVRLSTTEENAEIYYTIEADNPSISVTNKVYTEPIEIRSTMTIRAIARVNGKRDSEELRVTYYLDKTLKPGGNDPDDDGNVVPPEDIPSDETDLPKDSDGIPMGLWVTDMPKDIVYTGSAIKPEVRVYDYKKRLEEKKDYTISYKNNVNAADKNSPKAPTITITGKGNYEGKLLKTFTIAPKSIKDADVKADDLTVASNGKAQKPAPVVTWKNKKLTNKKDYVVVVVSPEPYVDEGTYQIKLTGTGNYTGEREISFTITNATPASKLTVSKIAAQTYTGTKIEPAVTVKFGKEELKPNMDYTVSYEDNTEVGTAAVIITGMNRFSGVKRVNFSINAVAAMSKAKAELIWGNTPAIYTGKAVTASEYKVTVQAKVNGVTETRELVKDKDYKVTYQNNIKAGTATAVFEGINAYSGTLKKTFKISAYDVLMNPTGKLVIESKASYPYMKGGSTPKPVIKFDGKTLTEGTDYTLSYKNHTAAGNYAVMIIKGKGNFTGNAQAGFTVLQQDISNLTVSPADKAYQSKANIYQTKVQVLDSNGKALSAGKDYDKNFIYTYVRSTKVRDAVTGAEVTRKKEEEVAATDIIPALTEICVTVNAAGSNYLGKASGTYRIGRASIANAKVTVLDQTYSGKPIELKESDITVILNGMLLSPENYKITGYTNNVNKGTAKLTIQGQGENYGGTKTVTFKIKGKSLLSQLFR